MKTKPSQAPPLYPPGGEIGATLWDHYAAAALTGLLAAGDKVAEKNPDTIERMVAGAACSLADAMLAERARREME